MKSMKRLATMHLPDYRANLELYNSLHVPSGPTRATDEIMHETDARALTIPSSNLELCMEHVGNDGMPVRLINGNK